MKMFNECIFTVYTVILCPLDLQAYQFNPELNPPSGVSIHVIVHVLVQVLRFPNTSQNVTGGRISEYKQPDPNDGYKKRPMGTLSKVGLLRPNPGSRPEIRGPADQGARESGAGIQGIRSRKPGIQGIWGQEARGRATGIQRTREPRSQGIRGTGSQGAVPVGTRPPK